MSKRKAIHTKANRQCTAHPQLMTFQNRKMEKLTCPSMSVIRNHTNRLLSGQHLNSETCRQQDEKSMDALFFFTRTTFQNLLCYQSPLNKSYHSLFLPSWNKQSISSFFNKMWFLLHRSLCLENCPLHSVKN